MGAGAAGGPCAEGRAPRSLGAALAAGLSAARVLAEVLEGCLEVPADAGLEALLRAGRAAASEGRSGEGAACFLRAERSARGRAAALAEVGVALAGAGGRGAQRVCGAARAALGAGSTAAAVEPDVLLCEGLALLGPTAPAGAEAPPDPARGVALLRQAAELRPGDPRLGHYLGEALFQSVQFSARAGDHAAALAAADGALDRAPGRPAAWAAKVLKARGMAQRHLGLPREAAASFERALQAAPGDPELRANLGLLLGHLGDAAGAVAHLRAATREAPGFFEAHLHLAGALQGQFRHGEALEALERALALESPRAWAQKLQLQRELCLWNDLAAVEARVAGDARRQLEGGTSASSAPLRTSLTPFDVLLTRTVPPELARSVAERYHAAALVAVAAEVADRPDGGGGGGAAPPSPPPAGRRRLRVGYLSSDFGESPVGRLVAGLPGFHRRGRRVEAWMLALRRGDGSLPWRAFQEGSRNFLDLSSLSHAEAAQRVRAEGLDVLVDLMGFSGGAHALQRDLLVAQAPAPLAVGLVGFPGTAGGPGAVRYAVADRVFAPLSSLFSEKLLYMPHAYQVNDYRRRAGGDRPPDAAGEGLAAARLAPEVPAGAFAFAHFNSLRKACPEVFGVWMNILRRAPGSVLWLLKMPAGTVAHLRNEAAARGIAPERLVFGEPLPHDLHLRRCARADLFLDSLHYGAHTTASDALWAGVPVLTLPRRAPAARVAASLRRAAGAALLARSLFEYEDMAVRLTRAPPPGTLPGEAAASARGAAPAAARAA